MKYTVLLIFFAITSLFGEDIKISADKFQADEINKISLFEGNVKITKGKDKIEAQKLTIIFDAKNKPIKYSAEGKPNFVFFIKDKHYKGKADKIIYTPVERKYLLLGNVFVHEIKEDRKIYGDKLTIDKANGRIVIIGKKNQPVKFIFKVEEKK